MELLEQIATAENNKKHLHLLHKEGLCVLLSVQLWFQLLCYHYHISRFCCNRFSGVSFNWNNWKTV